ncbi:dihydrolipoamide dehydrogenase [Terrimicrobium sacchariphilum]|jgi:dihydrolipoamide dehydrogenase|uniref:Dihydrolipoyl dehydrogenase n=1 Tax=Terrimicrobium sacchariphilum TaxID=690879 RepID=A0A146G1V1_TERSA|nr:dihydrolipoyl dehydrogenase [Terrimicrobium sacchariphilum]GAT31620.1 dihydrolipoamide dehydrogenase [Terrimicrobium sacchariphilum]
MADYDLIVVGGGPAGYVGAIRAAQLGKKVACVEMDRAGGTCLNWGCIPTKSLLKNAEVYQQLKNHGSEFGIKIEGLSYEWDKIIGRSRKVADRLAGGIEMLFKKNKIDYIRGEAAIPKAGVVEVTDKDGKKSEHKAGKILVATGVVTRELPGFPFNGKSVIGSKQALVIAEQPKEIIIIGAGAIGIEFAYFFNAFGSKVTVVEMQPNILPVEDTEVSVTLEKSLAKQGIKILTNTKVEKTETTNKGVRITVSGKTTETLEADVALVAIGVSPLLPQGLKVDLDRGYIKTDDNYETSLKGVYAAGDIIGPPWLAHVASYEAIQAVEGMFGVTKPKKVTVFPGCTYCHPQVASVGLTERAAKEKGLKFKVGKFPFIASGKALATGDSEGFVKLIVGEPHGEILGAHIIGGDATEMIAELGLAINLEATIDEIGGTIHAHPTLSESVMEASHAAEGHAIHI